MKIKKNALTFSPRPSGGFDCHDLAEVPTKFVERHDAGELQRAIDRYLTTLRETADAKFATKEEHDAHSEDERSTLGQSRFDAVVAELKAKTECMGLFERFLFWFGQWWYYHPAMMRGIRLDRKQLHDLKRQTLSDLIPPTLPEAVQEVVRDMELAEVASNRNHFALLFVDGDTETRRIVTDTQLFELRGVSGYVYLDITLDGQPIARSACRKDGGRAFFDGVRLMSHDRFMTCAPKAVVVDGGYKVNSTLCTLINGLLYELIDEDDRVAHTDGAFLGMCDFTSFQHADASAVAEESAARLQIQDSLVILDAVEIKPIGAFMPSKVTLLDSGFSLYDWADFHEIESIRYEHVLVVDDSEPWIDAVMRTFRGEVKQLRSLRTHSAQAALDEILTTEPDAVLLDMHLTEDERFDGLWIANQLVSRCFQGAIMITSGYPEKALRAMQALIRTDTVAPGKDLEKVRRALCRELV